jgi:hypothetical protein
MYHWVEHWGRGQQNTSVQATDKILQNRVIYRQNIRVFQALCYFFIVVMKV